MKSFFFYIFISALMLNCQNSPLAIEEEPIEHFQLAEVEEVNCISNTTIGECALTLNAIEYELPEDRCEVYDHWVRVDTDFEAPAGLEEGSTSKIEWEFLPKGNAGFWTTPIENPDDYNSGEIQMHGCFSFGEQDTLRIRRTIKDQDGIVSNLVSIDIPKPKEKKASKNLVSGLKILSYVSTVQN